MVWFRLDDSFYLHPKVMDAGNAAVGCFIRCCCWSAQQLTDGHIPVEMADRLGTPAQLRKVTAARLWVEVDGEYVVPDWLEYNPSALEVKTQREMWRETKRKAGQKRAASADRNPDGTFR